MKCSKCGSIVTDGNKFCTQCGAKLIKTCPVCSREIPYMAEFCTNCGTRLEKTGDLKEKTNEQPKKNTVSDNINEYEDFWPKMTDDKYRNRLVIIARTVNIVAILIILISFFSAYGYHHIYGWKWVAIGGFGVGIIIGSIGLSAGGHLVGERLKKYDVALKENGENAAKEIAKFKPVDYLCIVVMILTLMLTPVISDVICSGIAKKVFLNPDAGVIEIIMDLLYK